MTAIQIPNWVAGPVPGAARSGARLGAGNTVREKYQSNLANIEKYLDMAGQAGCDLTAIGECFPQLSLVSLVPGTNGAWHQRCN